MKTYGPYSPIISSGDIHFISGQIGVDPQTSKAADDVSQQTKQVMENMQTVLQSHGLSLDNVFKTTIYVTDMSAFAEVNEVYQQFFAVPRPARATVAVRELPRVADNPILVEIEAIATSNKRGSK